MKALIKLICIVTLFFMNLPTYAQILPSQLGDASAKNCNLVKWASNAAADIISIQNGNGASLIVQITVDSGSQAGINLSNCGTTTHIDSGSTAICITRDARTPITFVTDNPTKATSGFYIVQLYR